MRMNNYFTAVFCPRVIIYLNVVKYMIFLFLDNNGNLNKGG